MRIIRYSFLAIAAAGITLSAGLGVASAAPGDGHGGNHPQLTDQQRQCLADRGITRDSRPQGKPSDDQIAKIKDAFSACGIQLPDHPKLTDQQKQCLTDQGLTRDSHPEGKPSDDQIAKAKAAFEACGIAAPNR